MMTPYRPTHGAGSRKREGLDEVPDRNAAGEAAVPEPGVASLIAGVRARWAELGTTRRGRAIRGGIIAGVFILILGAAVAVARRPVPVPPLVGLTQAAARQRLTDAGLVLVVRGTELSSDVPKGSVASQDPTAGVSIARGSLVVVLVSAGSGLVPLPDLLGMSLDQATTTLKGLGLVVEVGTEQSVAPSGTVIDTVPSAGDAVQSGDTVHLTLASNGTISVAEDLSGNSFVIDPAPPAFLSGRDVAFDVASRLAELLRMAGASVTITRGALGSADMPGVTTRATSARSADATAVIGFSVGGDSKPGLMVVAVPSSESSLSPGGSGLLADAIDISLASDFSAAATQSADFDAVLSGAGHPSVRIRLGSTAVPADAAAFQDADWAQKVAHDVYRGLAAVFGRSS
jgi:N-acetylmuramoyl-L-alanine amidase